MKIVLLAHSYPPTIGGGESHVYTIAKIAGSLGNHVAVITSPILYDSLSKSKGRPKLKNVIIYDLPGLREMSLGLIGFREVLPKLFGLLNKIKPDVIHVHNFGPCLFLSYLSKSFSARICFTYHSTPVPREGKIIGYFDDYRMEKAFSNFIFTKTNYDVLICPSKYYLDWAKKLGAPKERIKLVYHGADTDLFFPKINDKDKIRKNYGFSREDYLICSPIRLIRRKGILDLITALGKIKIKQIKLVIPTSLNVVKPDFKNDILKLVVKLQIQDRITFLWDKVEYTTMPKIYNMCNVVVLPSHTEGLGLVLLEAMACGIPVIGTSTSGIKEVIVPSVNGLLVRPNNPNQLAKAIMRIYLDKELSGKLVKNGLEFIKTRFNAKRQIQELLKIYENC